MGISAQTFNPHRTPIEQLIGMTVGREDLVEGILEALRGASEGGALPQWLVTGQRGMGKTHLLLYLFHKVRSEDFLRKHWVTVHLREEEYWKTHSAATFVRLLVQRLAAQEAQTGGEAPSQLVAAATELLTMPSDQEMFNRARAALDKFARTTGRRILIGAENLDALFRQFQNPVVEGRMLRDILQHGSISLLGTSITTELGSDLEGRKNPLYRLFRIEPLSRFTLEQQRMQLRRLADAEEDEAARSRVVSFLRERESSLRVIHRLSGGNPRLGVILFGVIAGPEGMLQSIDLLHSLLDINTPYFQDRIKDLAPLERPLAAAFCEAETTLTGAEAARMTGQDRNMVYSLLARLRRAGFIEAVEWNARPGRRGNHYQVAEDLLRMWWQFRFDQQSLVKKVVEFLAVVYSRKELEGIRSTYRKWVDSPSGCDFDSSLVNTGLSYTNAALELHGSDHFVTMTAEMETTEITQEGQTTAKRRGRSAKTEARKDSMKKVQSLVATGVELLENGRGPEAEVTFQEALKLEPRHSGLWSNLGVACLMQEKFDEAVAALRKAVELESEQSMIWHNLGMAYGLLDRHDETEVALQIATELESARGETWYNLGISRQKQSKHNEAEIAFIKATELMPEDTKAWVNLGGVCLFQHKFNDAADAFRQATQIDPKSSPAWSNLGAVLAIMERHSEAELALGKAIELDPEEASPWFNLGVTLAALNRHEEAVAAFRRSVDLEPADPTNWGRLAEAIMAAEDRQSARELVDQLLCLQDQLGQSGLAALLQVAKEGAADLEEIVGIVVERLAAAEDKDEDLSPLIGTAFDVLLDIPDIEDVADLHQRAGMIDTLGSSDERLASVSILKHVLDYFLAMAEPPSERRKKSLTPMERAQEVLVRVPRELRDAVRELVEKVTEGATTRLESR